MGGVTAPLGSLEELSSTEDRTLYAYRPKKRPLRGFVFVAGALAMVAGSLYFGRFTTGVASWTILIVPMFAASALAFCGMLDFLRRPYFHLEVDRRAKTLSLAMPREQGQALTKVRFADVVSVEIAEKKGPPPAWNVTLVLQDARRIGLGISDDRAASELLATRFSDLIGVAVVRPPLA